jgi:hypothetical protein
MKQHITTMQLDELSDSQFIELHKKFGLKGNLKGIEVFSFRRISTKDGNIPYCIAPLSIGQMIEFLGESFKGLTIGLGIDDQGFDVEMWKATFDSGEGYLNNNMAFEVVDALWKAIKSILNEK